MIMAELSLRDIKNYLQQHGQATLTDLAHHFHRDPSLIHSMLQHWIQKGKVSHTQIAACSKGCCQGGNDLNIYRWIEKDKTLNSIPIIPNCQPY